MMATGTAPLGANAVAHRFYVTVSLNNQNTNVFRGVLSPRLALL